MYRNRIEVTFDAGHRLLDYPGKCASPHGHTYKAEVFVVTEELDTLGLGIDFSELKGRCRDWIDRNWDHGFLLNDKDLQLIEAFNNLSEAKIYLFPDQNPSAEAMACELYGVAEHFGWRVESVRIWESPSLFAEYAPGGVPALRQVQKEAVR